MKMFQPWNDTVRLLSGDWVSRPSRKPTAFDVRQPLEIELPLQKVAPHPAIGLLTLIVLTLILIL